MASPDQAAPSPPVDRRSGEDSEIQDTLRMAVDVLEGGSPAKTYEGAVVMIQEAIGQDPAKVFALVEVVHELICSRRKWANVIAIKFYNQLFKVLDLDFVSDDKSSDHPTSGNDVVVRAIIDQCMDQLNKDESWNWSIVPSCLVLEFVEEAFREGSDLLSATVMSDVITRMSKSEYLFFYNNLDMLLNLVVRVVPRIKKLEPSGKSAQVEDALQRLREREPQGSIGQTESIERVVDFFISTTSDYVDEDRTEAKRMDGGSAKAERGDEDLIEAVRNIDIAVVTRANTDREARLGLALLDQEADWNSQPVRRILDGIQEQVTIGASQDLQDTAYRAIGSMVKSNMLYQGTNLQTLAFFLLRGGPVLDAMWTSSPSMRLTSHLESLKDDPRQRTSKQERDINALCRNLGRAFILDMGTLDASTSNGNIADADTSTADAAAVGASTTDTSNANTPNTEASNTDQEQADNDKTGAASPT